MKDLESAIKRRNELRARLQAEQTRCLRLATESEAGFDVDAYQLESGMWTLFVQLKEPSQKKLDWKNIAGAVSADLGQAVVLIGGAVKTPSGSEPVGVLYGSESEHSLWSQELGSWLKLEFSNVLNPGVFMDQRDNRRLLLELFAKRKATGAEPTLLNLFSYTGAFSVLAARHGFRTTSVDLSKRYLSWEGANHEKNQTTQNSRRIPEDARVFLERLLRRAQVTPFDFIVLDPPTFSRSNRGTFRVQDELPRLAELCLKVLAHEGVLLASTNDKSWPEDVFLRTMSELAKSHGCHLQPGLLPEDFRPNKGEVYGFKSALLFRKR